MDAFFKKLADDEELQKKFVAFAEQQGFESSGLLSGVRMECPHYVCCVIVAIDGFLGKPIGHKDDLV